MGREKENSDAGREFNNWIGDIKKMRVKADYKDLEINELKAKEVKDKSFNVIETLKNNFNV
ncbi:MAG: hypothetical protein OHK0045_17860 [Raineya sp.]